MNHNLEAHVEFAMKALADAREKEEEIRVMLSSASQLCEDIRYQEPSDNQVIALDVARAHKDVLELALCRARKDSQRLLVIASNAHVALALAPSQAADEARSWLADQLNRLCDSIPSSDLNVQDDDDEEEDEEQNED